MEPGDSLGRYHIEARLARGGMAEVWLATSKGAGGFQKRVVLKTIIPELVENQDFVKMFINEALLAARLNHAHIVQIFDLGNIEGQYFIAMEFVPGRSLRQISRASRQKGTLLPQWFVLRSMSSVCEALQFAHDCVDEKGQLLGLVHRDITPENIMVSFTGAVKVVDFGVARASSAAPLTRAGTLKGKYSYISPEQVKGATADRRSDIYSCGVVLYEMLVGGRPFTADNDLDLLRQVARGQFVSPGEAPWVNAELEHIIRRAMATDPAARYQEASELNEDLLSYLSDVRDRHGQREMSLLVSMLFPDEPAIPSDVLRRISSNPDLENELFFGLATPTPPQEHNPETVEYAEVEVIEGGADVETVEHAVAPTAETPDSLSVHRQDTSTFEITGLEDWVVKDPPAAPVAPAGSSTEPRQSPKAQEEQQKQPKKKRRLSWLSHLVRGKDEASQPTPSKLAPPSSEPLETAPARPRSDETPKKLEVAPQKPPRQDEPANRLEAAPKQVAPKATPEKETAGPASERGAKPTKPAAKATLARPTKAPPKLARPTTAPAKGDERKEKTGKKKVKEAAPPALPRPRAVSRQVTDVAVEPTPARELPEADAPEPAPPAPEPEAPARRRSISSIWRTPVASPGGDDDPIATVWNVWRPKDLAEKVPDTPAPQPRAPAVTPADSMTSISQTRGAQDPGPGEQAPRPTEPDLASPSGIPTGVGPNVFHVRRTVEAEGRDDDVFTSFRPGATLGSADLDARSSKPPRTRETRQEEGNPWRAAESPDREAALEFDKGLELMKRREYAAARAHWERAVSLAPFNRVYQANLKKLARLLEESQ